MGRKPNQLILEFFERGQKLEDASNRYQHTCSSHSYSHTANDHVDCYLYQDNCTCDCYIHRLPNHVQ